MHAVYPNLECQQRDVKVSYINSCTGLDLDAEHITGLLRRMALTAEASPARTLCMWRSRHRAATSFMTVTSWRCGNSTMTHASARQSYLQI